MRRFLKAVDRDGERYLMLVFYCTIVFVIVTEVLRRFIFSYSSLWGEEVARYAFIYLGWVGASYGVKQRAHIRFDVVLLALPKRVHGYVYIFGDIVTMVFACFAMYWSLQVIGTLLQFGGTSYALRINKAWFEAAIPLSFAMMMVRLVQSFIRDVRDLRAGRDAHRGALMFD
jgi:TRAP-type C4-dicarboxylate transport system permease small subunit